MSDKFPEKKIMPNQQLTWNLPLVRNRLNCMKTWIDVLKDHRSKSPMDIDIDIEFLEAHFEELKKELEIK
jgi:hypothetical protein